MLEILPVNGILNLVVAPGKDLVIGGRHVDKILSVLGLTRRVQLKVVPRARYTADQLGRWENISTFCRCWRGSNWQRRCECGAEGMHRFIVPSQRQLPFLDGLPFPHILRFFVFLKFVTGDLHSFNAW